MSQQRLAQRMSKAPPPNPLYPSEQPLAQGIDGEMWRVGHYLPYLRSKSSPTPAPNPGGHMRAFPPNSRRYNS